MKNLLLLLSIMSLGFSQAYSQTVQARIINTPDNGHMRVAGVNSMSWSGRALYNAAGRVIANWNPNFATDTIIEKTSGAGVRIDGVLLKDGGVTFASPLAIGSGGTGTGSAPSNGQLLIGNGTGYTLATITGTANRVTVSNSAGGIQLTTPQDIGTTSNVTFNNVTVNGTLSAPGLLVDNGWVSVNSAELLNAGSSPVTIVNAIAGRFVTPVAILVRYTAGGTGYTNGLFALKIQGATGSLTSIIDLTGTTSGTFSIPLGSSTSPNQIANAAIRLTTQSGANASLGNGSIEIKIIYATAPQ